VGYNTIPWNSRRINSLVKLCKVFQPMEEFTSADAKKRGADIMPQQFMTMRRNKLLIRSRMVEGKYQLVGVYHIPHHIHERVMDRIKNGYEEEA
jgi:hypothetical protein